MAHRRIAAILLSAALLGTTPGVSALDLTRWNAANLVFACSQFTTGEISMWCGRHATSLYKDNVWPNTDSRLRESSRVVWSGASALGMTKIALDAFIQRHGTSPRDCEPSPDRLNAVDFSGVQTGSFNVPRWIDGRLVALLFSSQPITRSLCVSESGLYRIDVVARDDLPSPVEIEVLLEDWLLGTLSYETGTQEWTTLSLRGALPSGQHLLTLRFANDFADITAGIDRNALIDSVQIALLEQCP